MKKIWLIVLAFSMVLSSLSLSVAADDLSGEPILMTITDNKTSTLENGEVSLSDSWSVSTPTDASGQANFGSPKGEPTIYTGTVNATTVFTPSKGILGEGYYKVDFYKILYAGANSRPVVRFEIYHNGELDTEVFNFNEVPTQNVKEYVDLGTYYFKGDGTEYVKAVNTAGGCTLRVSTVKFTPSAATEEISADRGGILITGAPVANSCWENTTGHPKCVTAKGEQNVYSTSAANAFAKYTAELTEEGYYDVYLYKVRYNIASTAKLNVYIMHDGRRDQAEVDFSDMTTGNASAWAYLGRYYFSANAKNEYVSFENTVAGQYARVGGLKLSKVSVPSQGYEETIIRAKDADNTSKNGFSWAESSAIKADDGSDTVFSTAQGARFTFKASSLTGGNYKVYYYRAPYTAGNDNNIWVTISHNGKTHAKSFDYSAGEKEWVCIGEFDFEGGSEDEGVTLMRVQSHGNNSVSTRATAVKFVKNAPAEETDTYIIAPAFADGGNIKTAAVSESNCTTAAGYVINGVFPYAAYTDKSYINYYLPTSGVKAGNYDVYMTIFTASRGANPAVTVKHNGEIASPDVDITTISPDPEGFYKIGTYYFKGDGHDEYVKLQNTVNSLARFGAVKFVYKGNDVKAPDGKLSADVLYSDGSESISKTMLPSKTTMALRVAVENGTDANVTDVPEVFVGVFRNNGLFMIKKLSTYARSIEAGETAHYIGNVPGMVYEEGDVVRAFVWQNGMKPVDALEALNITE